MVTGFFKKLTNKLFNSSSKFAKNLENVVDEAAESEEDLKSSANEEKHVEKPKIKEPEKEKIYRIIDYEHPIFSAETFNAQKDIGLIQGENQTWFCGSYLGYGFHEDGIKSGLNVAERISGMTRKWLE